MAEQKKRKRKRSNGEGHIEKRGQSWRAQATVKGQRISCTAPTKEEALELLTLKKSEILRGQFIFDNDVTVQEFVETWMEKEKKPFVREQTYNGYRRLFENHLFPILGNYKLQDLTRPLLQQKYAEMFQEKSGKNFTQKDYARSTVNQLSVQFKKCLSFAVQEGILAKNPHEGLRLHKLREEKKIDAYTDTDQEKIINYTRNNGWHYWLFYFLIATGMRFGEAVALTWDDVDFNNKTIRINKTSVEISGSPTIQEKAKTEAGTRSFPISEKLELFLNEIKEQQIDELNFRNLVLPNTRYGIYTSANCRRRWIGVCEKLEIPYNGIHALRHSWATRALEAGIDIKTVSDLLGHKDVLTTMNIYQDVLKSHKDAAAEKMDMFI